MSTGIPEERDVDIIDREQLDAAYQIHFEHQWIVQWPNGFYLTFPTEAEAACVQENWRAAESGKV